LLLLHETARWMSNNLRDDLLQEFRSERKMINMQVEELDPLATSLRKPAAQRIISSGGLIVLELLCYLLCAGGIAFMIFMKKIYPFYLLSDMTYDQTVRSHYGLVNLAYLNIAIYGLAALHCILFYLLGLCLRRIRQKNNILHIAGGTIKNVVGQILNRKAAIEAIEQRHFIDLPELHSSFATGSIEGVRKAKINEVPNPGFDGEEAE